MGFFKQLAGRRLSYNDGTQQAQGLDRAQMGDLDSYTGPDGVNSPAQAGFRAIDQLGNAIFDSMGLIAVMKTLDIKSSTSPTTITSTSPVIVSGMAAIIILKRPSKVIVALSSTAKTSGAGGTFASGSIYVDGSLFSSAGLWDKANGYTNSSITLPIDEVTNGSVLGLGPHFIDYRVQVDSGQTWLNYASSLSLYSQGA